MSAIKGAVGMLLIVLMFWMTPPDRDPTFMNLPWKLQALAILGALLLMVGGALLILWGALGPIGSGNSEDKT